MSTCCYLGCKNVSITVCLELKLVRTSGAWCDSLHLTNLHTVKWSAFMFSVLKVIQIWLDRLGTYLNWILSNCELNHFVDNQWTICFLYKIKVRNIVKSKVGQNKRWFVLGFFDIGWYWRQWQLVFKCRQPEMTEYKKLTQMDRLVT